MKLLVCASLPRAKRQVSEAFMPRPHWSTRQTIKMRQEVLSRIRGIYASASLKLWKKEMASLSYGVVSEAFMPRPHWSFSRLPGKISKRLCIRGIYASASLKRRSKKKTKKKHGEVSEAFMPRPHWSDDFFYKSSTKKISIRGIYASASLKLLA